jgi:anti-sigma B factor antagonist
LDLSAFKQSGVQIIRLKGKVALGEAVDSFRDALEQALASGENRVVVNLSEVSMVDSSGIGVLVRYHTLTKQAGGAIRLVNPAKFVMQSLKTVGVLALFEVLETEDAAIETFP